MRPPPEKLVRALKVVAFLLCLGPAAVLIWKGFHGDELGANPIDVITRTTGRWTLTFLLITLGVTPVRKIVRMPWLVRFRRMLGLFAFFYGTLHLLTYVWLDKFFDVHEMLHDILKRRFITAGMTAFALMLPLALTSTKGWIRRLGGKRWQRLHRLIYFSAAAGVIHFVWLVKADLRRPLTYGAILAFLLAYRALAWATAKVSAKPAVPAVGNSPG
ncbi:MAG TPA: protein-methionine-sulfoxide reductase heme-binding subunit MsrQ [Verrucomicrobiae bacterium]|jgi:sulfoxide reductase heme-binding subunit YedZ|nr:protein-methionine-sulfoxide reductase heme-binding subunit MsrQ [Verrucomicrobiae bacterium]